MKPSFSIWSRSTPCCSASSAAFFVTDARPGRAAAAAALATAAARLRVGELVRALGDERDARRRSRPRARRGRAGTRMPSPGASISIDAFDVSTTQTAWPLRTGFPVVGEPLDEQRGLAVRVLAREDDLEHASAPGAGELGDRRDDVADARQHVVLERTRRRDDPVARGDAPDRPAQVAPRVAAAPVRRSRRRRRR